MACLNIFKGRKGPFALTFLLTARQNFHLLCTLSTSFRATNCGISPFGSCTHFTKFSAIFKRLYACLIHTKRHSWHDSIQNSCFRFHGIDAYCFIYNCRLLNYLYEMLLRNESVANFITDVEKVRVCRSQPQSNPHIPGRNVFPHLNRCKPYTLHVAYFFPQSLHYGIFTFINSQESDGIRWPF